MQDNDLPQIGTPMQTDETQAREVLRTTLDGLQMDYRQEHAAIRAMLAFANPAATLAPDLAALIRRNTVAGGFANTVAIAEEAFEMGVKSAAPTAVEREGDRWRFARYLNGIRMAEGVAVTLADDLDTAISKAVKLCPKAPSGCQILVLTHAKGSPTLHPSDREEGVQEGFDAAVAAIRSWADGFIGGDSGLRLRATAADLEANRSAILALSGSLAPANPTERDPA